MTREEQIIAKAGDLSDFAINHGYPASYANGYYEGFQEGAKWADKNPKEGLVSIDEVCEYLMKNDKGFILTEMSITELRKAMEDRAL